MPNIAANGISLEYEDHGNPADPTILLIMGLGTQMIAWPDAFVAALVQAGFRVIRYDNRDVGRSSWLNGKRTVSPMLLLAARRFGIRLPVPYTLTDMADDGLSLMDALGIPAAHIVGASMGGMIAQLIAARAPQHVLSLTSIMSSSGARNLPPAAPEIQSRLLGRPPKGATREQLFERSAETLKMISYPDPARPVSEFRKMANRAAERGNNPAGYTRHLLAIIADGSRVRRLSTIKVPTLVIHGAADQLVPVACGVDTAKHIPGARLEVIEEMAHDIPPSQISKLASLIAEHARAAQPDALHQTAKPVAL